MWLKRKRILYLKWINTISIFQNFIDRSRTFHIVNTKVLPINQVCKQYTMKILVKIFNKKAVTQLAEYFEQLLQ